MPAEHVPSITPERRIWAVIPSTERFGARDVHYMLVHGNIPHTIHRTGEGTTEDTLSALGRQVIGISLSPDYAYHVTPSSLVYFTKAVDPYRLEPKEGVAWTAQPSAALSPDFRQFAAEIVAGFDEAA